MPPFTFNEYCLQTVAKSLSNIPVSFQLSSFDCAVFYLPLQDPKDPPEQGKYGGDSFCVKELPNGNTFFMLRNGAGHGGEGRKAIKEANTLLEKILAQNQGYDYASKTTVSPIDWHQRLDVLVYALNDALYASQATPGSLASTAILGVQTKDTLQYVNCGDSAIIVVDKEGRPKNKPLEDSSFYDIGWMDIKFLEQFKLPHTVQVHSLPLKKGDTILAFSDGVYQAGEEELSKQYGIQPLLSLLAIYPQDSPRIIISNINTHIKQYLKGASLGDDYTMLVLRKSA